MKQSFAALPSESFKSIIGKCLESELKVSALFLPDGKTYEDLNDFFGYEKTSEEIKNPDTQIPESKALSDIEILSEGGESGDKKGSPEEDDIVQQYLQSEEYRVYEAKCRAKGEAALAKLNAMEGLEPIKREVRRQLAYHKVMTARKGGMPACPKRLMHLIFTGNPGTGKTTIAKIISEIYFGFGLIDSDRFVEATRGSLVSGWIGQTEEKTLEALNDARGGILFIDEMYALVTDITDGRDYGQRVVDTLMTYLSDPSKNVMVIGAGYPDKMKYFLESNPGLQSRFPTIIEFPDFSTDELFRIADTRLREYGFEFTPESADGFRRLLEECRTMKGFGNGRTAVVAIESHVVPNACCRLVDADTLGLTEVLVEDLPTVSQLFPLREEKRRNLGFS